MAAAGSRSAEREASAVAADADRGGSQAAFSAAAGEPGPEAAQQDAAEKRVHEEVAALGQLGEDLLGWFRGSMELMGTEARLLMASLLLVLALAAMVGLLVAGAVIFLGAAAMLLLVREGGISPPMAALLGALVLGAGAAAAYIWIRHLAGEMGFTRTRKSWAALFRSAEGAGGRQE